MLEIFLDMCLFEEFYRVEDLKDILKCFVKFYVNIGVEFCQFGEKFKEIID